MAEEQTIKSVLDSIKTSRDNIATAISNKGVTVPTNVKLAELASLVSTIEKGFDVSGVTATADDVVEGKTIMTAEGDLVEGTIPEKSSSNLTRTSNKIIVPKGYYPDGAEGSVPFGTYDASISLTAGEGQATAEGINVTLKEANEPEVGGYYVNVGGRGKVSGTAYAKITKSGYVSQNTLNASDEAVSNWGTKYYQIRTEEKSVTPTTASQEVVAGNGALLYKVIVNAIPKLGEKVYTVSNDTPLLYIDEGYHDDTMVQIVREREQTVTPSNVDQTITPASGKVLSTVKVNGDANLVAGNIKNGVSIFGVTGTYKGDIATCTVNIKWSVTTNYALITATTFTNGAISRFVSKTGNGTVTIPNVLCGSVITVYTGAMTSVYGWSYGKDDSYDNFTHTLTVPTSAGTYTAEIGVIDD